MAKAKVAQKKMFDEPNGVEPVGDAWNPDRQAVVLAGDCNSAFQDVKARATQLATKAMRPLRSRPCLAVARLHTLTIPAHGHIINAS